MSAPVQLQTGEEVIVTIRRHPSRLIGRLLLVVLFVLLVLFFWTQFGLGREGFLGNSMDFLLIITLIGGAIAAFSIWYGYQHDVWLITNQRLVDSSKPTPFRHTVTSSNLENIVDVTTSRNGIFQTMLNYGDVSCRTAAANAKTFRFRGVAAPDMVLAQINEARETYKAQSAARLQGTITEALVASKSGGDTAVDAP